MTCAHRRWRARSRRCRCDARAQRRAMARAQRSESDESVSAARRATRGARRAYLRSSSERRMPSSTAVANALTPASPSRLPLSDSARSAPRGKHAVASAAAPSAPTRLLLKSSVASVLPRCTPAASAPAPMSDTRLSERSSATSRQLRAASSAASAAAPLSAMRLRASDRTRKSSPCSVHADAASTAAQRRACTSRSPRSASFAPSGPPGRTARGSGSQTPPTPTAVIHGDAASAVASCAVRCALASRSTPSIGACAMPACS